MYVLPGCLQTCLLIRSCRGMQVGVCNDQLASYNFSPYAANCVVGTHMLLIHRFCSLFHFANHICHPLPRTHIGVCNMWTPREQHAVTNYGGYMYVSGGYASRLYDRFSNCGDLACGDTDASSYRYFLADVWRSADGGVWQRVTAT
jgi:hypothetical protein